MSLGIYPVFKPKLRRAKFKALGEILAHEYQTLDQITKDNGLTPFTTFAETEKCQTILMVRLTIWRS